MGYLPAPTMRRVADLTPGNTKTDARDAAVTAEAARTTPHTLRKTGQARMDAKLRAPTGRRHITRANTITDTQLSPR